MPFAPQVSQFSDASIPFDVAVSLCGPAAAIAFARVNGRSPTLREVKALAAEVGWSPARGMAGPASEQALLRRMGVESDLAPTADPARVRADVAAGKPVIVSTGLHYFTLSDVDPATGKFYVGTSGTDLKNGSPWMSLDEIDRASRDRGYGGVNGALHLASTPTVPRDRQQFLEANSPGEGAAIDDNHAPTTQEPRGGPSDDRPADSLPATDPATPVADTVPPATAGANANAYDPERAAAEAFGPRLLAQLAAAAAAGASSPYRLPGADLPGWRPTRFRLPGVA